jgi:solute carrier family 25 phosphate transporter 23/24/25/41
MAATTATTPRVAAAIAPADSARDAVVNTTKALSAGALAGALSRTVTSPLERLKVMKQVQATNTKYNGIFAALARMYREEGLRGYWKGNGTNVARIAPFSAIQFFSFDVYKQLIMGNDAQAGFVKTFTAGALTGMTASTMCYPLDLVRSVLSVQTTQTHYNSIWGAMKSIVAKDGVLGLYRGLGPTLMGIAPYIAINMTTFDLLKNRYLPKTRDAPYFTLINLGLGATSGFVSAALTYPTDLIRRRMQLQGMQGGHDLPAYTSTWHCITHTVKTEGVKGMYKGMGACFLKVVPSMAIAFTSYELLRSSWGFDPSKLAKAPSGGG